MVSLPQVFFLTCFTFGCLPKSEVPGPPGGPKIDSKSVPGGSRDAPDLPDGPPLPPSPPRLLHGKARQAVAESCESACQSCDGFLLLQTSNIIGRLQKGRNRHTLDMHYDESVLFTAREACWACDGFLVFDVLRVTLSLAFILAVFVRSG